MRRIGSVIKLKEQHIEKYKQLHAEVWPDVLSQISRSHIHNYSIFLREPENILFSYFEYTGDDLDADMAIMAADPITQKWWEVCKPCQEPLDDSGEWWASTEEVFHHD